MTEQNKPLKEEDITCLGCKFATTYDLAKGIRLECDETKGLVLDLNKVRCALQGLLDMNKRLIEELSDSSLKQQFERGRRSGLLSMRNVIYEYLGAVLDKEEK